MRGMMLSRKRGGFANSSSVSTAEIRRAAAPVRAGLPVSAMAAKIPNRKRMRNRSGRRFQWNRLRSPDVAALRQCRRRNHHGQRCEHYLEAAHKLLAPHAISVDTSPSSKSCQYRLPALIWRKLARSVICAGSELKRDRSPLFCLVSRRARSGADGPSGLGGRPGP